MDDPTLWDIAWDAAVNFLSSKGFLVATAIFFLYLLVTGVLRKIKNIVCAFFGALFGMLSPFRLRQVFFYALSLVFMTASFSLYAGTRAGLNGEDSTFHAILGGSLAVGIWSVVLLLATSLRENRSPARRRAKKGGFQSTSGKVTPPTSLRKD